MKTPLNTVKDIEREKLKAQIKDVERQIMEYTRLILADTSKASDVNFNRRRDALVVKLAGFERKVELLGKPPRVRCTARKN